jgi:hypothetical protein
VNDGGDGRVRGVSRCVYESLLHGDRLCRAECAPFGIATEGHYQALQWAVRNEGLTLEQLDRARMDGRALEALISPQNPHHGVRFQPGHEALRRQEQSQRRGRDRGFPR